MIRAGFEPTTRSLEGCCSIQLSYRTNIRSAKVKLFFLSEIRLKKKKTPIPALFFTFAEIKITSLLRKYEYIHQDKLIPTK